MKNMITFSAIALGFLAISGAPKATSALTSCPTGWYNCPVCGGCIQNGTPCNSSSCSNVHEVPLAPTKDVYVLDPGAIVSCQPDHVLKPVPIGTGNSTGVVYWSCQQGAESVPQKKP
ncbi:MAG: hypothetical protein JSR85_08715 [Proteobacteria bacterium]|nr:hypothetical protein [Pseudomonadota bacterium]